MKLTMIATLILGVAWAVSLLLGAPSAALGLACFVCGVLMVVQIADSMTEKAD
jgi:hypothetical protein